MAISGEQTAINNNYTKNRLFNHYNARFMEESTLLLLDLSMLFHKISLIIDDDEKLRDSELDYRQLAFIKNDVTTNRGNVNYLVGILSQKLQFIERYDKTLAQLISKYGQTKSRQREILANLYSITRGSSKLSVNMNILLENVELLDDQDLKSKIKNRLILIRKYLYETQVLNYGLEDANNWGIHAHDDLSFFVERIETYFKGGWTRDRRSFISLDNFKEDNLKKSILGSEEIKKIYYLIQFMHKVEAQLDYISKKIEFLQRDINNGVWIRNVATKEFYEHVEEYADDFRKEFKNMPFADSLLKHKEIIREDPFAWIKFLEKMRKILEQFMSMKNSAIEDAKNYIYQAFKKKKDLLDSLITQLSSQLNEIIITQSEDTNTIKQIEEGIKRIEKAINLLWKERKKKFNKIKINIDRLSIYVTPELDRLTQTFNIISEGNMLIQNLRAMAKFSDHHEKLTKAIGPKPTSKNFGHLGMLAFDYARMENIATTINFTEQLIKQKDSQLRDYNLTKLKKSIKELIDMYNELINFIKLTKILIDISLISNKINKFNGDYYG